MTFFGGYGVQAANNQSKTGDKVTDNNASNGTKVSANLSKRRHYVSVSATGEGVMNYAALPPELNGWRRSRLEYGGHAEQCFMEKIIYYPPGGNDYIFDLLFDFWQATTRNKRQNLLHQITQELERSL
jgi:hypothetical protein